MPDVDTGWVSEYAEAASVAARRFEINTPLRMAAWLGNIAYESGQLNYWREFTPPLSLGNYYGRGPIQLTGEGNYEACGDYIGHDLVGNPDLVASDTLIGFMSAAWFYRYGNGDQNVFADEGDFWTCYLRVLGSDNGTFPERKVFYDRALHSLGEEVIVTTTVTPADIIQIGRQMLGAEYSQWDGTWPPEDGAPFWMTGDVSVDLVKRDGCNCAGFLNAILRILGLPPAGGTGSIGDYLIDLEDFDVNLPAVPGAIALRPWTGGVGNLEEGHVAIYLDEHTLLQSDHRGVNEQDQDYDSQPWAGFTVYGLLPGVNYEQGSPPGDQTDKEMWEKYGWWTYESEKSWNLRYFPPGNA